MKRSRETFFKVLLPLFVVVNIGLGVLVLAQLGPGKMPELQWLLIGAGAFCCTVGGWLAGSGWSKSYWGQNMARQVVAWQRIVDAIFAWIEDLPISPEAMNKLKHRLDDAMVKSRSH
jgi:hypothetical protein